MTQSSVDPNTAALLVMDFQTAVVEMIGGDKEARLARTAALVDRARNLGMRIVYIVVAFRAGYPEISPRNQSFASLRASGRFAEGTPGTEVHAALAPKPGDVVVTKHRVSAFAGTDLEMILRAHSIDTLVLTGLATSGVVLSTVRHAADADYRIVVVEDCCGDRDDEVHRTLMDKVFPRQATVIKSQELIAALGGRN
jgi:nicotinamidase-related amidase